MKKSRKHIKKWLTVSFVSAMIFVFTGAGVSYAKKYDAKPKYQKTDTVKIQRGSKALGPQPEPPDKPGKGSKALGPQPEPPDRQ